MSPIAQAERPSVAVHAQVAADVKERLEELPRLNERSVAAELRLAVRQNRLTPPWPTWPFEWRHLGSAATDRGRQHRP
jgi:hypothetical protein